MWQTRLGGVLVVIGAAIAIGTAVSVAQEPAPPAQPAGLPDLTMHEIVDVKAHPLYTRRGTKLRRRWAVRFSSTVDNIGPGHFVINASRPRVGSPCPPTGNGRCEKRNMRGDQLILKADGSTTTKRNVAVVYFDPYHYHWHLRAANRYEIRSASSKRRLVRDRKSGFCFGDRVRNVDPAPPQYPGLGDGLSNCLYANDDPAQDGRRALELTEGISAGFGDDYSSFKNGEPLEGQQLEVSRLKAGRYTLVNRTNATGKFREVSRANNASSVLIKLSWPKGRKRKPAIRVLASCPGKARCAVTKPSSA